jgi:hypothetical protein
MYTRTTITVKKSFDELIGTRVTARTKDGTKTGTVFGWHLTDTCTRYGMGFRYDSVALHLDEWGDTALYVTVATPLDR